MIANLKRYPAYKDSGVPWLGDVPEHWTIERLKKAALLNPSRTETRSSLAADTMVTFLPMERVGADGRIDAREITPACAVWNGFTYFRRQDVLVAKITPCFENGKGACLDALPTEVGFGSTEFHVLRARSSVSPDFLYRLTTIADFRRLGTDAMTGAAGQQRVPQSFVANFTIAIPPLAEQAAIVRFLDHADRRIRRYICAKQKLIKLLEEQKQAIIHRAVTRGLDPNVRLKPSGVEWLGDVPEHWEIRRIKQLFHEVDKRSSTGTEVLLSLRMYRGLVPHSEVSQIPITSNALVGFKRVAPGQIVMNRMRAAIGMFGVVLQSGLVSPDYAVFEPHDAVDPHYFLHLFKTPAARTVFRMESKGLGTGSSGFMRLYTERFGIVRVPLPPLIEQRAIVRGIADETVELERTKERIESEIGLLREYRTRLIADVVTGKLDVRGVELPGVGREEEEQGWDESEDTEGLEDARPEEEGANAVIGATEADE
jgi:type I restriction enzyme S subunit